ncbi:MAG TPA: cell envelope integrity protein TolA, partial [Nannocystis exedens]|nr:cell envelope integrity protein TolA [Nannocystis exedens]
MQRRRASAAVVLACLLLSAGINLGVVIASSTFLRGDPGPPSSAPELTISQPYCGELHRELADLVLTGPQGLMLPLVLGNFEAASQAATTPLQGGRLLLELGDVLFGPECDEAPMLVALVDPEVLPTDEEILDVEELELEPPKPKPDPKEKPEPEKELEDQPLPEPEPEPVPEPEPEPEKEEEKEKIDFTLEQLKMVEQLDEHDDDHSPDDAHYLSNINRDVLEETRANITNLIEDAEVPKAAQEEPSEEPEKGTANEEKIAETEEQKSQLARLSPETKAEPKPQLKQENDPQPKSLLSMRDLPKREHSAAMTEQNSLANAADDGSLDAERQAQAPVSARDEQRARQRSTHATNKFKLSQRDLTAAFGKDVAAEKNLVSQRQSKQKGVWEEARERWQSPLENMVPEVRPGNQTALRSRKHPFARYIATIHRTVHDLWAWGFLDQLDTRPRNHPLNNVKLWTRVEIVLLGDGKIDSVKTVRFSGNTGFDAAAREIVYASAPFPTPPRSILSGNGKVYIHWAFHRDARACGTFGAEPFILDNAGQGDRPDPSRPVRATSSQRRADRSRRLSRQLPPSQSGPEGPQPPK